VDRPIKVSSAPAASDPSAEGSFMEETASDFIVAVDDSDDEVDDDPLGVHRQQRHADAATRLAGQSSSSSFPGSLPAGASPSAEAGGLRPSALPGMYERSEESDTTYAAQVLEALMAAGYELGQRAASFLASLEEEYGYQQRTACLLSEAKVAVLQKASEIDEAHKISLQVGMFPDAMLRCACDERQVEADVLGL